MPCSRVCVCLEAVPGEAQREQEQEQELRERGPRLSCEAEEAEARRRVNLSTQVLASVERVRRQQQGSKRRGHGMV